MNNLNDLKEEIKQRLIFSKGDFNINQHNDLIDFANSINITPNDLLFIVLDIESSINWDEIDKLSTSNTSQLETFDDSNDINYTTVSQRQFEKLESNNIIDSSTPNKLINITKTLLLSLFAIVFLISVYLFWGKDYIRDLNAKRMYSIASSLKLRSDAYDGSDYNVIGNILYGSELLVYEDENSFGADWVNCKYDNKIGYASSKYILDKPNFFLLESIYANSETKELVGQTRFKKALLNYFSTNRLVGNLSKEQQTEFYGKDNNRDIWQLEVVNFIKNSPNNIYFSYKSSQNSKFNDFACIIKNINTQERKTLVFSFDDNENYKLELEEPVSANKFINYIYYSYNNYGTLYLQVYYIDNN
jgi:hypothetical protein